MMISTRKVKTLNKIFQAGFTSEKAISAMSVDDILNLPGINVSEIALINELQKSVRSGMLIRFLAGNEGKTDEGDSDYDKI
mgnify:FL=1